MSSLTRRIAASVPLTRAIAIAALLGTTMLVSPLIAVRAAAGMQLAQAAAPPNEEGPAGAAEQTQAAAGAAATKEETVEQRITELHNALEITAEQEPEWNNVAQAMRENAANMAKLVGEVSTAAPEGMTAVESLQAYQQFAQARANGMKNLIASFETLYNSMPEAQKKNADEVFQAFGHKGALRRK